MSLVAQVGGRARVKQVSTALGLMAEECLDLDLDLPAGVEALECLVTSDPGDRRGRDGDLDLGLKYCDGQSRRGGERCWPKYCLGHLLRESERPLWRGSMRWRDRDRERGGMIAGQ